jgi:hypothetical protein
VHGASVTSQSRQRRVLRRRRIRRMTFRISAIPGDVVVQLLVRDDSGRAPQLLTDHAGGSPVRCCLRASRPGEQLALVSYAPLRRWAAANEVDPGAYDETGPVFLHAQPCRGSAGDGYPEELRDAPRMLRAYSRTGRILRAVQVPPYGPFEKELDALLDDPDVAVVHGRAVEFGCFTFAAERA